MRDLFMDYGGVVVAGEVADTQGSHLGDVERYVGDVCGRTEGFTGVLAGFAGTYADAVAAATAGLRSSRSAAAHFGREARAGAVDMAAVDLAVRRRFERLLDRLGDLWPAVPTPEHVGVPVHGFAAPRHAPPGALPDVELAAPVDSVVRSPLPVAQWTGLEPNLPDGLGTAFGADHERLAERDPEDPRPWRQGTLGSTGEFIGHGGRMFGRLLVSMDDVRGIARTSADLDGLAGDLDDYEDFIASAQDSS